MVPNAVGGPHVPKPTAKSVFAKLHSKAAHQRLKTVDGDPGDSGHGVDADEAESVELRGEYQQSITGAPGIAAPAAGLLVAQRAGAALPTYPGRWHEVTNNPFVNDLIPRGANYGVGSGNVTGRMTALTHSGSTVFAGLRSPASGGVWRSRDGGGRWKPVNSGMPRLAIGALATSPSDGAVWAGTGEANNASENQYGVGVYRLAKGANTWRRVGTSELDGAGSFRIVWIRGYAYIATSHGLYRRAQNAPFRAHSQVVLQPHGNAIYPPNSSVTDVIAVPGSGNTRIMAVVGWAGYSNPPATGRNGFYVA